jgi:hypothetical protein
VGSEKDNLSSCPEADDLLPARGAESGPSSASEAALSHAASCPSCGELARARELLAQELRRLPRAAAPAGARSGVDFGLVMQAVHGKLDAELARDEARWRPSLSDLERIAMPAAVAERVAVRLLEVEPAIVARRTRVLQLVRRVATVAAAAGVVAAALLSRSAPQAADGLAAETRRLSGSTPIDVRLVDLPAPTDPAGAARLLGGSWIPPRGGGP